MARSDGTQKRNITVICYLMIGFLICFGYQIQAQNRSNQKSWIILPIVYYTPETKLALGAGALHTFHLGDEFTHQRASNVQIGGVYTLEKQILSYFSWDLFHSEQRWELAGEVGYYKYSYDYWGIGNHSRREDEENYQIQFPRVRLFPRYLLSDHLGLGFSIDFNHYNPLDIQTNGLLDANQTTGIAGGYVIGIGPMMRWDHRSHNNFPTSGFYLDYKTRFYTPSLQSDYRYTSMEGDLRYFKTLLSNWVWAQQFYVKFNWGQVPFYDMALLGGNKLMRGYYQGRFRDHHMWLIQCECRIPIHPRIFLVPFISLGDVFSPGASPRLILAGGGGVRYMIKPEDRINLRLDFGYGEKFQFYFSVLEAF